MCNYIETVKERFLLGRGSVYGLFKLPKILNCVFLKGLLGSANN